MSMTSHESGGAAITSGSARSPRMTPSSGITTSAARLRAFQVYVQSKKADGTVLDATTNVHYELAKLSILLLDPTRPCPELIDQDAFQRTIGHLQRQYGHDSYQFPAATWLPAADLIDARRLRNKDALLDINRKCRELISYCDDMPSSKAITSTIMRSFYNFLMDHPIEPRHDTVESKEISSIVSTALFPLLDRPDKCVFLRWTVYKHSDPQIQRKDLILTIIQHVNGADTAIGFGEMAGHSIAMLPVDVLGKDLVRVARLCKNTLDSSPCQHCMLAFVIVEQNVTFYLVDGRSEVHTMVHLGKIKMPLCINEVPDYLNHADDLGFILRTYETFCIIKPPT
ncbi:hypothetical protein BC940DRAFT_337305 [Gongronella butleri]|nr:hypothetical protein BC940DRAFT_337305 [Gongronella butleri]